MNARVRILFTLLALLACAHAAPEEYRKEISARFEQLRRKYGLGSRPDRPSAEKQWRSPQLMFDLNAST